MSRRLTFANVTSVVALTVALGGGGAAVAAGLAKDSVGTRQIIDGAVKNPDLNTNAVTSGKVRNGTLTGADIDQDTLAPQTAVAASGNQGEVELPEQRTDVASVSLDAPKDGTMIITATSNFRARTGTQYVTGQVVSSDGFVITPFVWDAGDVDAFTDQAQSFTTLQPAAKGPHTYTLQLEEATTGSEPSLAYNPRIFVEFVPNK